MTTDPDAYFILQVDSQADDYVISAAYRAAARRYHGRERARCLADDLLNDAYDRVKTSEARHRYDASRAAGRGRIWPRNPDL
jgi:DnaJ-class molecular chaperone